MFGCHCGDDARGDVCACAGAEGVALVLLLLLLLVGGVDLGDVFVGEA